MTCQAGVLFVCVAAATVGCTRSETPATPAVSSPQTTFNYEKQVGIASHQGANVGCLAIFNDALQPGAKVVLADQPPNEQYDKPGVREAGILEHESEECDHHLSASHDVEGKESYYKIRSSDAEWQGNGYQFAIVDPKQPLSVLDGKVAGDIDGDGTPESFRNCSSSEGVHFQVWTGVPLEGRGRWHWYVYAGYDLEYNCTEKDYFGPK
jgi:hypothetical protein